MSRNNRTVPTTGTVRCRKCGRSAKVNVTGRGQVQTYGRVHAATQHGGVIRQAQGNKGLLRRIFGG